MCAQFTLKTKGSDIKAAFQLSDILEIPDFDQRFLPHSFAPVAVLADQETRLRNMNFSLIPSWSKERRVKFATHNARLYSVDEKTGLEIPIYEKPTWKRPFLSKHGVVPMTHFIEPIYENEYAGHMVKFGDVSGDILFAAAIWDEWIDKATGEIIESFAVLTDDPPNFVSDIGHDRCPLFLNSSALEEWLQTSKSVKPDKLIDFLRNERAAVEFAVEVDRPLKDGWQKRVPKQQSLKLD